MKLLLDTCTLLWFLTNVRSVAKAAVEDAANERW